MSTTRLYYTILEQLVELWPGKRITRLRILAWLMVGMFASRSVYLHHIALKIPGTARKESKVKRLWRWIHNPAIRPREWYEPLARDLLAQAARTVGTVRLILDTTEVGRHHQILKVSLAFRRRTLPLAWVAVPYPKGHTPAFVQKALLSYVRSLIPPHTPVEVVGDSEFGNACLIRSFQNWGWKFALRLKGGFLFRTGGENAPWQRVDSLISFPSQERWLPDAQLFQSHGLNVSLWAYWHPGEKHPWLIATNFESPRAPHRPYKRRMWIEESFGDSKDHGVRFHLSRLHRNSSLSRLALAVFLLYLLLIAFGTKTIKRGWRKLVDRVKRRDLSIFRIGWDMMEWCIVNELPIPISLIPYFR